MKEIVDFLFVRTPFALQWENIRLPKSKKEAEDHQKVRSYDHCRNFHFEVLK